MSHKKYRADKNCLNCGATVERRFCPECGQENIETKENFFHLVGHFISDYLHFDSKFFRSLIPLFTKPGFLTKQYWEGRRVRYIHPLRLFFFLTILFVISSSLFFKKYGEEIKGRMVMKKNDYQISPQDLATMPDTAVIEVKPLKEKMTVKQYKEELEQDDRQYNKLRRGFDLVFKNLKYVSFLLLPIFAVIFKLLYLRRRIYYVDHLVYTMHLQSFAYTLFGIILLLPLFFPIGLGVIQQISFLITFAYILISLRYLYGQAWWKTILKSVLATFLLVLTTSLSFAIIALIDAMLIQK